MKFREVNESEPESTWNSGRQKRSPVKFREANESEFVKLMDACVKPALCVERGRLAQYARLVHSASEGAVTG